MRDDVGRPPVQTSALPAGKYEATYANPLADPRAGARARRGRGGLAPSEKQWEAWIIEAFRTAGCVVYKLSQPRASMQGEGLPDLFVVWPRRRASWWFEVKRPGEKLRPAQLRFREHVLASGGRHYFGALSDAADVLRAIAGEDGAR